MDTHPKTDSTTTVFFDGSCPLCRREISIYKNAVPSIPIKWVDVSVGTQGIAGRSCGELMSRFHVQAADGILRSGAAAFVSLWLLYPGWRWLGKFGSLPGMHHVLELVYRCFLFVRPSVQWIFRKIEARGVMEK